MAGLLAAVAGVGGFLVAVLFLLRGMTYNGLAGAGADLPTWAAGVSTAAAETGLLGLVALYVYALLSARARSRWRLLAGIGGGFGVVCAYATSEVVKLLVSELRPCRNFDITTLAACPGPTDWAWPSNHATIAAAIATASIIAAPRVWVLVLGSAGAATIALARVVTGVHYPHDVVAGLLLGFMTVALFCRIAGPWLTATMNAVLDKVPERMRRAVFGVRPRIGRAARAAQ